MRLGSALAGASSSGGKGGKAPTGVAFRSGAANMEASTTRAIAADAARAFAILAVLAVADTGQSNVGSSGDA